MSPKKCQIFMLVPLLILSACDGCSEKQTNTVESNSAANKASIPETKAKLEIKDEKEGEGEPVKVGDTISVHYVGKLEDGTQFDSSRDRGKMLEFDLGRGQMIKGWARGIPGMKLGGIRTLIIPSDLAYGDRGVPGVIPPNATLIFEVELLKINGK